MEEAKEFILRGSGLRATSPTRLNADSSRSHAVLSFYLTRTTSSFDRFEELWVVKNVTTSKLNMVDLAGNEALQMTALPDVSGRDSTATMKAKLGEREQLLKTSMETMLINKSLNCLVNVIAAHSKVGSAQQQQHIPYRDSKLTRLLMVTSFIRSYIPCFIRTFLPSFLPSFPLRDRLLAFVFSPS